MSTKQIKIDRFNSIRLATHDRVDNLLSQLYSAAIDAAYEQAYMRKNPDLNGADELMVEASPRFSTSITEFNKVKAVLDGMIAVAFEEKTIDQQITDYAIDLVAYSSTLINSK